MQLPKQKSDFAGGVASGCLQQEVSPLQECPVVDNGMGTKKNETWLHVQSGSEKRRWTHIEYLEETTVAQVRTYPRQPYLSPNVTTKEDCSPS